MRRGPRVLATPCGSCILLWCSVCGPLGAAIGPHPWGNANRATDAHLKQQHKERR